MGQLADVAKWQIASIPIGAVAVGAAVGGIGDAAAGLVRGFAPQAPSWAVKGALAWATINWGSKWLGKEAAQMGALFLTYDAVQELFNIRQSVANIVGGLTGKVVSFSPPAFTGAGGGRSTDTLGRPTTAALISNPGL